MSIIVHLQTASSTINLPKKKKIQEWVTAVLNQRSEKSEIVIRIVDEKESQELNHYYRHKNKPTNVLSFPFTSPFESPLLGDLVLCAPVIAQEALAQNKALEVHWAHLVVHGVLHLLGYDHQIEEEAQIMETLEINILQTLGFPNPYL